MKILFKRWFRMVIILSFGYISENIIIILITEFITKWSIVYTNIRIYNQLYIYTNNWSCYKNISSTIRINIYLVVRAHTLCVQCVFFISLEVLIHRCPICYSNFRKQELEKKVYVFISLCPYHVVRCYIASMSLQLVSLFLKSIICGYVFEYSIVQGQFFQRQFEYVLGKRIVFEADFWIFK